MILYLRFNDYFRSKLFPRWQALAVHTWDQAKYREFSPL